MVMRDEPVTLLGWLILQSDHTLQEWADIVTKADQATMSVRNLGRLARAERRNPDGTVRLPGKITSRALEKVFGRPVEDLLSLTWASTRIPATPASGSVVLQAGPERSVLVMAADRAKRFLLLEGGTTPEKVEQLREDVQRLTVAYPQRPLAEILGELVETQDILFTLLERRQTPSVSRELHFLASIASGLLAKASHDLAEPQAAMMQARTAIMCANEADHNGLRAWQRGLQSMFAYWAGRYSEALRYAEAGTEFASQTRGTMSVWLPVSAARAHAALGNAEGALDAIHRAEQAWEHVEPDSLDEMGGIASFSLPRTLYYAADALAWLPDEAGEAQRYSEEAVAAYADPHHPDWAFGDQAGSHADLAIARVAAGDLAGAEEALAPVLDLMPEQRINGIVSSAHRVHRAIVRAGLAGDAAELVERIEDFTRTPLAALPR